MANRSDCILLFDSAPYRAIRDFIPLLSKKVHSIDNIYPHFIHVLLLLKIGGFLSENPKIGH